MINIERKINTPIPLIDWPRSDFLSKYISYLPLNPEPAHLTKAENILKKYLYISSRVQHCVYLSNRRGIPRLNISYRLSHRPTRRLPYFAFLFILWCQKKSARKSVYIISTQTSPHEYSCPKQKGICSYFDKSGYCHFQLVCSHYHPTRWRKLVRRACIPYYGNNKLMVLTPS